ncbi:hypothetical protein [Bradyrhizobium erythrophlei]|jgi:hypothetical protein|nr:hypothetical protein [Bradyrhizobium erythrophlei]
MTMFLLEDDRSNADPDSIALAQCETVCEVIVVTHHWLGLEGVDKLLDRVLPISTREQLRGEADELARVGLTPLAQLIRRRARKARSEPERNWWTIPDKDRRRAAFERQGGTRSISAKPGTFCRR